MTAITGIKKDGQLFFNVENAPSKVGVKVNHFLTSFFRSSIEIQVCLNSKIKNLHLDARSFKEWGRSQGLDLTAKLSKQQSSLLIQKYIFNKNHSNFLYPQATIGKGAAKFVHLTGAADLKLANFFERIFCRTVTLFVVTANGLEKVKVKKQKLVSWMQQQNIKADTRDSGVELAQRVYAKVIEPPKKSPSAEEQEKKLKAEEDRKAAEELAEKLKAEQAQKEAEELAEKLKAEQAQKEAEELAEKLKAEQAQKEAEELAEKLKAEQAQKEAEE
jgi:hypothetical protein